MSTMTVTPRNMAEAIREKLIALNCEFMLAEGMVAELIGKLMKQVGIDVWRRPLCDFKSPGTIEAAMWLQMELVAVDYLSREAPHHHLIQHFSPRWSPQRTTERFESHIS